MTQYMSFLRAIILRLRTVETNRVRDSWRGYTDDVEDLNLPHRHHIGSVGDRSVTVRHSRVCKTALP